MGQNVKKVFGAVTELAKTGDLNLTMIDDHFLLTYDNGAEATEAVSRTLCDAVLRLAEKRGLELDDLGSDIEEGAADGQS